MLEKEDLKQIEWDMFYMGGEPNSECYSISDNLAKCTTGLYGTHAYAPSGGTNIVWTRWFRDGGGGWYTSSQSNVDNVYYNDISVELSSSSSSSSKTISGLLFALEGQISSSSVQILVLSSW